MRTLSATLLAAQKKATSTPYVKLIARNRIAGVVRLDWSRLYTGAEPDYYHALAMAGDGSMVRARVTPPSDARKLYRQRVTSPGPASDFSFWTYTGYYNVLAVTAAALGAEVSVFWINTSREIRRIKSTDYGANWDAPEIIDYSPTTNVYGLAAAYKPGGDLALFFADQATLYVKKHVSGGWQSKSAWDKTTGDLSGVGCCYDTDWDLVVTGKDSAGNYKLWSLVYGDGGEVSAGTWSALKEIASAPASGSFQYLQPFLDKPGVHRAFYVDKFTGTEAYSRPFWSHVATIPFASGLWREPVPFNLASDYGLAIAHHGNYAWLSCPAGVWRAGLTEQTLDLSADIMAARQEAGLGIGRLTAVLRNDDGRYASPGAGAIAILNTGCQLDFSPGYLTTAGNEASDGPTFSLEAYEHTSAGGKASLVLHGEDGWGALSRWQARHQFRWNKSSSEASVKDLIAFLVARVGLKLEVISESSTVTGFYPDFTINPGNSGDAVLAKLLSYVPDVVFIEGATAYLVNPQSSDASVYSYGTDHAILEGRYLKSAWALNRAQAAGHDGSGNPVIAERFGWGEIDRIYDRVALIDDRNIDSATKAQQRGDAYLREAEIESVGGSVLVPVNCGQRPVDVIAITDARAGLSAVKKRVLGFSLVYNPARAEYTQRLKLGAT